MKSKKDVGKWCKFHKIPWHNTNECLSRQSLLVEMKSSELDANSDSDSEPNNGKHILMHNQVSPSLPQNSNERNQRILNKGSAFSTHRCG
jgi:hypothetical protein